MVLTRIRLAAVYASLRAFEPFSSWGLPKTCEVYFGVAPMRTLMGKYIREERGGRTIHTIAVSSKTVGQFSTLCRLMAHEMIHLHQGVRRTYSRSEHNHEFHRLAREVCDEFGWDRKEFV